MTTQTGEAVIALKDEYPKGARVQFLGFGRPDPYSGLEPGEQGTVTFVDDLGTVHVEWDGGGHLGMVVYPVYDGDEPDSIARIDS